MKTEEYQRVFEKLNEIRNRNEKIRYIYLLRPLPNDKIVFLVDADSNYFLPFLMDTNKDGILNEADEGVYPGLEYDVSPFPNFKKGMIRPTTEENLTTDKWGTFMSAYAPLIRNGETIAVLEIDMDITTLLKLTRERFQIWFWFFGVLTAILLVGICWSLKKRFLTT